ncbi:uncharacterized protein EDB93DRAFT_1242126 [Suillus bovinus]|uniref:uncharacterized protein n=1 Tax=Suillus bovinus TaxID=48563 RepID=UPI001B86C7DE|nr:uncharacterized protein EDB93DRAFT_1242126 [Suillus bovinus]KAG2138440.1 hypothetical protein EDB93DRAFT_1242126 [Suillus bovinus]
MRETCSCKGEEPLLYRCRDCFGAEMVCHACVLQWHAHSPLHRIELRIQLGHNPGETCYNPEPAAGNDFVVIDVHGIHEIGLDFCSCETAQIHYKQLIHTQWFLATAMNPQTAATFALMEFFYFLAFESKVSAYEFYHSITRRTDNTSITPIRMLKRAGRGHNPSGVDATSAGKCAVLCPACPHPGKNLPKGWEDAPHDIRWKYALFLAIDANFWLKRKLVSSDNVDPSLNASSCYFVEDTAYTQYLSEHGCELQEKSTCVSHNTVNMADTKSSRGLAAMGVGTMDCARYDMKLPNRVGDLQKGERYLNMDYLVFSVMVSFAIVIFNLSYDIACQWHKKLWPHMASMPPRLHLSRKNKIILFFNVGHTDGEAPERGWANINCKWGQEQCCDTLDDHFSDWNWKKVTMLSMLRKVKEASRRAKLHREELDKLQQSIPASSLSMWKSEIEAWEEDNTQPNPFESRLAEKEATDLQAGADVSLHANISPSVLIASGIDLQDQQRCLAADISSLGQHATDTQKTKVLNQSNALQHQLDNWAQIQLDPHLPCDQRLCECEWELRYAQAHDALNDVQQHIHLFTHLNAFRMANVQGQRASTHACTTLNLAAEKKHASKAKYNAARDALTVGWSDILHPLAWTDMRPMGDFIQGQSEGTHDIPWIWKTPGVLQDDDEGLQDCLCIEWCKARAREARWSEEVLLLLEEMQRVLTFLTWQGTWWSGLASARHFKRLADSKGSRAYANRQSALREAMVEKFRQCWATHTGNG